MCIRDRCNLIAEQAGQVIDNRTFQVGLFDEGYYDIRYWTIDGRPQPVPQCFDLAAPHDPAASAGGLVGWVRDSQQPLLVRDFQREMDRLPAQMCIRDRFSTVWYSSSKAFSSRP